MRISTQKLVPGNVVHCKKDKFDIYCGRKTKEFEASKWANPFVMQNDSVTERCNVINKFECWLNTQPDLLLDVQSLNGKILGCWCSPKSCHCDILVKYSQSKYVTNWFSNMFQLDRPFIYQNITYLTSENFYQAMKLPKDRIDLREKIAGMNPYQAKKAIRNKNNFPWRESWNQEESLKVMEFILNIKFAKGTIWRYKLDLTEDWEITEWNNWNDTFWGKNINTREGENNLGKILMKIRDFA